MKNLSNIILFIFSIMVIIPSIACDDEDELPADPRLWTTEQLLGNAFLEQPDNTDGIQILHVEGNDYQMGYQHGYLLREQLYAAVEYLNTAPLWALGLTMARSYNLDGHTFEYYAEQISYDFIKEQCEGMADGSFQAIDYNTCLIMNSVVWGLEHLLSEIDISGIACSGFVVKDEGTVDGKLYHGRNLDWDAMDPILDYPTLIINKPDGKNSYVNVGWAGWVSILSGMNEYGIALQLDEDSSETIDLDGVSHMQMLAKILRDCSTLDEALAIVNESNHATAELLLISDGKTEEAAVVELNAEIVAIRTMDEEGIVRYSYDEQLDYENLIFVTNHCEDPAMDDYQKPGNLENMQSDSIGRYTRILERLTGTSRYYSDPNPSDPDYAYNYGEIDVETAINILRDPIDMRDRSIVPCDDTTVYHAVGNNHNVESVVFVPEDLHLWFAGGRDDECGNNVLQNPYIGYDLNELLTGTHTGSLPIYDPEREDFE